MTDQEMSQDPPDELEQARAELSTLRAQLQRAQEALWSCKNYFQGNLPVGNPLMNEIDAALSSLPSTDGVLVPRELLERIVENTETFDDERMLRALLASTKGG